MSMHTLEALMISFSSMLQHWLNTATITKTVWACQRVQNNRSVSALEKVKQCLWNMEALSEKLFEDVMLSLLLEQKKRKASQQCRPYNSSSYELCWRYSKNELVKLFSGVLSFRFEFQISFSRLVVRYTYCHFCTRILFLGKNIQSFNRPQHARNYTEIISVF